MRRPTFPKRQNFTPRPDRNYSSPVQQNSSYRRMQEQRTGGSRQDLNQRLDDTDYICFTIQHLDIMRVNIYFFVLALI